MVLFLEVQRAALRVGKAGTPYLPVGKPSRLAFPALKRGACSLDIWAKVTLENLLFEKGWKIFTRKSKKGKPSTIKHRVEKEDLVS